MTLNELIDDLIELRQYSGADNPVLVVMSDPKSMLSFVGQVTKVHYGMNESQCKLKSDLDMEASKKLAGDLREFHKQFQQTLVDFGCYGEENK